MLLLGAILLAIFVLPSPWGLVAVVAGGLTDVAESVALLKWSRRRRAVTGVEVLIGKTAVVSIADAGPRRRGDLGGEVRRAARRR